MHQKRSKPGMFISSLLLKWAHITPINFPIVLSMPKEGCLPLRKHARSWPFASGKGGGEAVSGSPFLWAEALRPFSSSPDSSSPHSPDISRVQAKALLSQPFSHWVTAWDGSCSPCPERGVKTLSPARLQGTWLLPSRVSRSHYSTLNSW